ncbi:MAG: DNA gyrase inhibitor YacG [Polyangiales bacterium]
MPADETTCPICRRRFDAAAAPTRPFCSQRCKMVDLGQWLTESYRVPGEDLVEDEDSSESPS